MILNIAKVFFIFVYDIKNGPAIKKTTGPLRLKRIFINEDQQLPMIFHDHCQYTE